MIVRLPRKWSAQGNKKRTNRFIDEHPAGDIRQVDTIDNSRGDAIPDVATDDEKTPSVSIGMKTIPAIVL